MTQLSWWWTSDDTGDGQTGGYSVAQVSRFYRMMTQGSNGGGVWPDFENQLAVSGTSSPIQVATGGANVYGFGYSNDASENVVIPTPAANTRIDRIVLRLVWSSEQVRIHRIAGTEGGSAPALVQNSGTSWDIPLAQVSVTTGGVITVTDEREFLNVVAPGGVSTAKLADGAVTEAKIAGGAVATAKIADSAVATAKIADSAVNEGKIANSAVTEGKIANDAVTSSKIASSAVTETKINNGAVATDKLAAKAVTNAKLRDSAALSVIGRSSNSSGAPADIAAGTDGHVLRRAGTALGFGQVATAGIANKAVDDTKAGNRVLQFYRLQGANLSNWSTGGSNNLTPSAVRAQGGSVSGSTALGGGGYSSVGITFPVAFSAAPLVFATLERDTGSTSYNTNLLVGNITTTGFTIYVQSSDASVSFIVRWLAIGPE